MVDTGNPEHASKRYVIGHEVTCLGLCTIGTKKFLTVAIWQLEKTTLLLYDLNAPETEPCLVFPLSLLGKVPLYLKATLIVLELTNTTNEFDARSRIKWNRDRQ